MEPITIGTWITILTMGGSFVAWCSRTNSRLTKLEEDLKELDPASLKVEVRLLRQEISQLRAMLDQIASFKVNGKNS